jgi:hypothetical protein
MATVTVGTFSYVSLTKWYTAPLRWHAIQRTETSHWSFSFITYSLWLPFSMVRWTLHLVASFNSLMIRTSITHWFPVVNNENVLSFKILTQLTWSINGLLNGLASLRTSVQSSGLRLRTKYLWQTHHQNINSFLNLKTETHFNSHVYKKMLQNKYLGRELLLLCRWRQQESTGVLSLTYFPMYFVWWLEYFIWYQHINHTSYLYTLQPAVLWQYNIQNLYPGVDKSLAWPTFRSI